VFLAAVVDVEVLNARVQQLQFGALALVVRAVSMEALNVPLRTAQRAALALDEGQSLTIRIAHTLQSWWGYLAGEQAHGLDNCFRIVVGSLCHVIRQVHLELEVSAIVGSAEQHAREVALMAYFFSFDDCRPICQVNVCRPHSPSNEFHCHKSWLLTICTSVRLNHADQGLEVFHILCVGHVVGLVVRRHSMLCLLEGIGALLTVVEAAAVPSDD